MHTNAQILCTPADLPSGLVGLHQKSDHLLKAIEFFDGGYKVAAGKVAAFGDGQSAARSNEGAEAIEDQVRLYIMDALDTVARDIDDIATTLIDDIDVKMRNVGNLTLQADLLKTHIDLGKNYFMLQKFSAIMQSSEKEEKPAPMKRVLPFFEQAESEHLFEEDYQKKESLRRVAATVDKFIKMGSCLYKASGKSYAYNAYEDPLVAEFDKISVNESSTSGPVRSKMPGAQGIRNPKARFKPRSKAV